MKISITQKIVWSFCLLIILLLLAQIGFNVFLSKSYFVEQNKKEVEKVYETIIKNYSDEVENLYNLTQEADTTRGYSIQIFSEEQLIYTSRTMKQEQYTNGRLDEAKPLQEPVLPRNENNENPGNKYNNVNAMWGNLNLKTEDFTMEAKTDIIRMPGSEIEVLSLMGKFYYNEEVRYISITLPMESITNSIVLFTKSNLIIALFILFIGVILILGLAKEITKPIKNMEKATGKLANLEFTYFVDEKVKTQELSGLASSINSMSRQLEGVMNQLKQANIKLKKDMEKQKKQEDMRKQFVANVSHEMKTPLALLQIYCENLKNDIEGIDKEESCNIIIEETQRLNKIVSDMLNVAVLENELLQCHKTKINLTQTTKELLNTMAPLLQENKIELEIKEDLYVLGDKEQLEEAMRNFIMNAISYTKPLNVIRIRLIKEEDLIRFSVYNQGQGIPKEKQENLWGSFYKSDESRTRTQGANAGLGLYVVKVTMDNHGGNCGVNNRDDGVEFNFELKEASILN